MAISLVGTAENSVSYSLTYDVTLPTLAENDVVYLFVVNNESSAETPAVTTPSGYTKLIDVSYPGSYPNTHRFYVFRKKMGASPDSSVTVSFGGASYATSAAVAVCLRGVDTTTQEDATTTTAGWTGSTFPDSPSITTVTNNAWVISAFGIGYENSDDNVTVPSGYSNKVVSFASYYGACTVGAATKEIASAGAENPAAWDVRVGDYWYAVSVAVRPAITVHELSATSLTVGSPVFGTTGIAATFLRYFDEYSTGNDTLTDWTRQTGAAISTIATNTDYFRRELTCSSGASSQFTLDPPGATNKMEVRGLFLTPDLTSATQIAICARQQASLVSCYYLGFKDVSGTKTVTLGCINNGSITAETALTGLTWVANDVWYGVINVDGTAIKAKAWKWGESEPGSWQAELTNSTFATGKAGVRLSAGAKEYYFFSVGTNGALSPLPSFTLTGSSLDVTSPALGTPALTINTVTFVAEALTTSSPVIDTPALTQGHVLTATSIAVDVPGFDAAALTQEHVLTATSIAVDVPTFDTPQLVQEHTLTATSVAITAPQFDEAVLAQEHVLTATSVAITAPVFDTPAIGQEHVLIALELAVNSPAFGPAVLALEGEIVAVPLIVEAPTFDAPAIAQHHVLDVEALTISSPSLGEPALAIQCILTAEAVAVGAPVFDEPVISQVHALEAMSIIVGAPVLDEGIVVQDHVLTAASIVVDVPVLGEPVLLGALVAVGITVASPVLDVPALNVPDLWLADYVRDFGLKVLRDDANQIWVCTTQPWDYAEAESYKLGESDCIFGNPDTVAGGRRITALPVYAGSVTAVGNVGRWAVVDTLNERLLASGRLTGGTTTVMGFSWNLESISIVQPRD